MHIRFAGVVFAVFGTTYEISSSLRIYRAAGESIEQSLVNRQIFTSSWSTHVKCTRTSQQRPLHQCILLIVTTDRS